MSDLLRSRGKHRDSPTPIHRLYCQFPGLPGTKHDNRSTPISSDKHPELLKTEQRVTENRQSNRLIPARSSDSHGQIQGQDPSIRPRGEFQTSFTPQSELMETLNWNYLPRKTRNDTKLKTGDPGCNPGRAQRAGGRSSRVRIRSGLIPIPARSSDSHGQIQGRDPSVRPRGEFQTSFTPQSEPMETSNWNYLPRKTRNDTKLKTGDPGCNPGRAERAGGRSSCGRIRSGVIPIPARSSDRSCSTGRPHLSARVTRINLVSPAMGRNKAFQQDISTTKRHEIARKRHRGKPGCNPGRAQRQEVTVCQFFAVCCCWANLGGLTAVALSLGGIVLTTFQARPSFSRTRIAP